MLHKPEDQPFIFEDVFSGETTPGQSKTGQSAYFNSPADKSPNYPDILSDPQLGGSPFGIKKEIFEPAKDAKTFLFENPKNLAFPPSDSIASPVPPQATDEVSMLPIGNGEASQKQDNFSFIRTKSIVHGPEQVDMVVLVHGLEGAHFDMKNIKGYFASHYPEIHILNSRANEGITHQDIDLQGFNLAAEVKKNIFEMVSEGSLRSLSFVGHSLGGLVVRASLPYLKEYRHKMLTFMSLCTPHLGAISSGNRLVDIGMWYMKNFKSDQSFLQMAGTDNPSFAQTFLFNLSLDTGLSWFKNVILAASHQDKYVNFHSARMELTDELAKDPRVAKLAENLISTLLKTSKVIRVNFNYNHAA